MKFSRTRLLTGGASAEFLSEFHKDDKLTPVITITVYWGSGKWDAPRSLHEMFGILTNV